ncbi:MAG TPA: helix-turn-helix domain-containing protein [Flavilitoribacter sp.]|nr:helix-turn-helix domain-containing protein [Flavilitoribacter sp.]HMQ85940.1 helix-turn-helix domain-containing protein [Flavilitoribacter sp.]
MAVLIQIKLNEKLYLRDPQETRLGRSIIQQSILLIDEIGFEQFTFKKLAERISSTEASIYRYFGNKHVLLVYLLCWYWEWTRFQIDYYTNNVQNPVERLKLALRVIVNASVRNASIEFVDEDILHRIVVAEGAKAYHTKEVDKENKEGYFSTYKALAKTLADMIADVNPDFIYPRALSSTLLEMANDQIYFSKHLPALTDIRISEDNMDQAVTLLQDFAFKMIR